MIYFAHRGASAAAPANSLPAFALARQVGATHYELDVHASRDGKLIVYHDYNLGTGSTCSLDIKDASWPEIATCRLWSATGQETPYRPPLLSEVLPVIMQGLELLNIEIKNDDNIYPGIEELLWKELQRMIPDGLNKILISSFDYPTLLRMRQLSSQVKIGWLTREFDVAKIDPLRAYSVHMNQTRITPEIVQTCHEKGCQVFIYTVNTAEDIQRLEYMGVDGVFTDRPSLLATR